MTKQTAKLMLRLNYADKAQTEHRSTTKKKYSLRCCVKLTNVKFYL